MSSSVSQPNPSKHEVEHLLLLVGKNPLPNAVAGKLLVKPGGTISLLYSNDTYRAMNALRDWFDGQLQSKGVKIKDKEVKEADRDSIVGGVRERLDTAEITSIGLHYTGGTKAMAVHAYRAVERWGNERRIDPVFSYLDARWLQLVIDGRDALYVGRAVEISLTDLIKLHDWTLQHNPRVNPVLPRTAQALAEACASAAGLEAWRKWKYEEMKNCCKPVDARGTRRFNRNWERDSALRRVRLSLTPPAAPLPSDVADALRAELALPASDFEIGATANAYGMAKAEEVCEWLDGKWLEHHTLAALNELKNPSHELHLHECAQNVAPKEVKFDLDVIALRGYQLFAFSCSTDRDDAGEGGRRDLKKRLFEVYIRARQLGGDEAGVALVCCAADPDGLQKEMRREMDALRLRVFGRRDLANLPAAIEEWIHEASYEV